MTRNFIDEDLSDQAKRVYFVGAGISANLPTGFPLATTLVSQLLRTLAPDLQILDLLETLADANRRNKRNPGDYVRFELLLDIIQQLVDSELSLLRLVELFTHTNSVHGFLAQRAIAGDFVVTTNFDCLIEESIRQLGFQPTSICTTADFESWRSLLAQGVPVFKIHGSYKRYNQSTSEPSLHTVQATLSSLTAGATDLVLPRAKREFLIEATHGNSMIVCGYSGGDDLDIIPTFKLLSPRSLHWLCHNGAHQVAHQVTEEWLRTLDETSESDFSPRDRFLRRQLLEDSYPVKIYEVNTPLYLVGDRDDNIKSGFSGGSDEANAKLETFIAEWARTFLVKPHLRYVVSGQILFNLTRFEEAYECYGKAWAIMEGTNEPYELADVARMISRIGVETNRFKEAEEWAQTSVDLCPSGSSARAKSIHQHGFAYYKLGNFSRALVCYKDAATICEQHDLDRFLSYVLHDTALIYQERSLFRKAIPLYEKSINLSANDGDIRHVMFSFHQLGTACFDLGEFSESRIYHLKALELARVLGNYAQIDNSEHELGMLDFMAGKLLESIRRFHRGIAIAKQTGRLQFIPMDLQHIGIALMEARKVRLAGRLLIAAKKEYELINDEITLSELQSYLCQYYLSLGDFATALTAAEVGHATAARFGAKEYETRAAFMIGLTVWMKHNKVEGARTMCDAINLAHSEEFNALLLDQLSLCARFSVHDMTCEALPALVHWAIKSYAELGNNRRRHILESFSENL